MSPCPPRRTPRLVWLLAAALALGVVVVAVARAPEIIAYFRGPQITPDNERALGGGGAALAVVNGLAPRLTQLDPRPQT
jgi:hypothetical protein